MRRLKDLSHIPWKIPGNLLLIFAILCAGILGLGYFYYEYQLAFFQKTKEGELNTIADLKVRQIVEWRKERMHDALMVVEDAAFAEKVQKWFDGKSPELHKEILERLQSLKRDFYVAITVFDPQGLSCLSIPALKPELLSLVKPLILEAINTDQVIFSDLYRVPGSNEINMSLMAPFHYHKGKERLVVGAVLLQIDPHDFLYPIIQSWPNPDKTGELVIVRRENEHEILFLNELRFSKAAPLTMRRSLTSTQLPAVNGVLGRKGIVKGVDYHGVPVLAATRKIPDSPWFLTAKVDLWEVIAPFNRWSHLIPMLSIAFVITVGLSIALIWRQRETDFYRQQIKTKKEKEKVLQESEEQLRFLSSQLLMVQENERCRISKELHDELGQTMVLLRFQLNRLSKQKRKSRADFQALLNHLDNMIENVRRLSWDLSPACLDQFGLAAALKNLLNEFGEQFEIRWSAEEMDALDYQFSDLAQVNIYRIFQESLTNIVRHAQASQITVGIEKHENRVLFILADNGQGFDLRQIERRKGRDRGIGLTAMQERALLAGGYLQIRSQPGAGTKISFTIPVERGEASHATVQNLAG